MPVEPFQAHAGWRQAEEAHAAIYRSHRGVHARIAEHPPEVDLVVFQIHVVIQQDFKHHIQRLIKQPTFDRVVVVLQESTDEFLCVLKLFQRQVNQQFQFQHCQLAPDRVVVKLNANQCGDVTVVIQLVVFQTFKQLCQAGIVQAVQIEDVGAKQKRLVGVVPYQIFQRIHLRVTRHQNPAGGCAQLVVDGHVRLFAHVFEDAKQFGSFLRVGVFAFARKIPLDKIEVGLGAEEAPGDHAAGINEVLNEVIGLRHGIAVEGRARQIVQPFKAPTLQQFGQAAFQGDLQAGVGAERGKYPACAGVHQSDAHHGVFPAQ